MIRKAKFGDLDAIECSYIELLEHEQENASFTNWKLGVYPTRTVAENALTDGTLYVLEENEAICGSMILNQKQPNEYTQINWNFKAEKNEVLVIHTLCIPPSMVRYGFGKQMISFALDYAKKIGYKVIRLDTYAGNGPAASLYEKMNFRYAGSADILLQGVIPENQIFFEYSQEG